MVYRLSARHQLLGEPRLTRSEIAALTTEQEWKDNASRVSSDDYLVLHDWSEQAEDPAIKAYLERMAISAYHRCNACAI